MLPKALLLDLDDTIINDTGCVRACWQKACDECAPVCGVNAGVLLQAIEKMGDWFWSDPERHRIGRLDLLVARTEVARLALAELGIESTKIATRMGGIYHRERDMGLHLFPDAVETVRWFRENGCKLALLTNGNGPPQRAKLERFGLAGLFDAVFIEGEVGYGKPDPRVYHLALETLRVDAQDTWMAGDNLEFDVEHPQRLGITGIWINAADKAHPKLASVRPGLVVRQLSELRKKRPMLQLLDVQADIRQGEPARPREGGSRPLEGQQPL